MFKNFKTNLLMILSIIFSILSLVSFFFVILNVQSNYGVLDPFSIDLLFVGIVFMLMSLLLSYKHKQIIKLKAIKTFYTVTRIKCANENCNYKEERFFQEGDYIFKECGSCPKCNNKLYIDSIYTNGTKPK